MNTDDFDPDFQQPFVQNYNFQQDATEKMRKRGMWIMRVMVGFAIISMIITCFFGIRHPIPTVIGIVIYVFLYRGLFLSRVLVAIDGIYSAYLYYQVYVLMAVLFGFGIASFFLFLMAYSLAMPLLIMFYTPVISFLQEQQNLY